MAKQTHETDITITRSGLSLFLFEPNNEDARTWLEANVDVEAQWWGDSLVVEHRCARPLAEVLLDEGFTIE